MTRAERELRDRAEKTANGYAEKGKTVEHGEAPEDFGGDGSAFSIRISVRGKDKGRVRVEYNT